MGSTNAKKMAWRKRKTRIRKNIVSTAERPRLTVFRSTNHIYGQIVDDVTGTTLASACSNEKTVKEQPKFDSKVAKAVFIGKLLAQRALEKGVKKVVFDRNGFLYHGRIKAFSD
ncbi:50S ribosomal protein L18, partial [Desulfosarcina sp. OttesenSCG-928-G17]|nr:50S ribosomal protein L18 [Desulfosarcina sp. OttesenSCG-928-G17]